MWFCTHSKEQLRDVIVLSTSQGLISRRVPWGKWEQQKLHRLLPTFVRKHPLSLMLGSVVCTLHSKIQSPGVAIQLIMPTPLAALWCWHWCHTLCLELCNLAMVTSLLPSLNMQCAFSCQCELMLLASCWQKVSAACIWLIPQSTNMSDLYQAMLIIMYGQQHAVCYKSTWRAC